MLDKAVCITLTIFIGFMCYLYIDFKQSEQLEIIISECIHDTKCINTVKHLPNNSDLCLSNKKCKEYIRKL